MIVKVLQWAIVALFCWYAWPWAWWVIRALVWIIVQVSHGAGP